MHICHKTFCQAENIWELDILFIFLYTLIIAWLWVNLQRSLLGGTWLLGFLCIVVGSTLKHLAQLLLWFGAVQITFYRCFSGCEFFKDYKDRDYTAEGLVFNWNQVENLLRQIRHWSEVSSVLSILLCIFWQDFVDAPLTIPRCFTHNLNIDWTQYQVNSLVFLLLLSSLSAITVMCWYYWCYSSICCPTCTDLGSLFITWLLVH